MRIAFVLNPAAQGGRARRVWPRLDAAAQALGLDHSVWQTLEPGDGARLARGLRETADLVVAVGGDGTVQEVASALAGTDTPFGVVPVGTGNDFAHAVGMPRRLDAALRALVETRPQRVDVGRVAWLDAGGRRGERLFTNCLGAGLDAQAALEAARYKVVSGRPAYLAGILRSLWVWRAPRADVEVSVGDAIATEGGPCATPIFEGPAILCEVGNGPTVGGGFRITPDAVLTDGLLDVCAVRHVPPRRVLALLPRAVAGTHAGQPEVVMARAPAVAVRARRGSLPLQADGESVTASAVWTSAAVWPGGLWVVAPGL